MCKTFCTPAGIQAAGLAIQFHGGYGYCREFRVEQVLRDDRITPIYEGTNGIQAMMDFETLDTALFAAP